MTQTNPLLQTEGLPQFDKIKAEQIEPAITTVLTECETLLQNIERMAQPSWGELSAALNLVNRKIHQAWGPVGHLIGTMNSAELRAEYEKMQPAVVDFSLRYAQSEPIYKFYKTMRDDSAIWNSLNSAQQRIVTNNIRDAELSGIALKGQAKSRFNEISKELSQLSTTFSNNVLDSTKQFEQILTTNEEIAGLPLSAKTLASQSYNLSKPERAGASTPESGPWRISLDPPSFISFMQHAESRSLREQLYRAYNSRASHGNHDNSGVIKKILELRQEKAKLLGFANFAELSLAKKMAPSVKAVDALSKDLLNASLAPGKKEFAELSGFAKSKGFTEPLAHWDTAFWSERLREHLFSYTDEELKPYFSLPSVLAGLFSLVEELFAIKVVPADNEAPKWHPDVRFFKINDLQGKQLAAFYLDPYSRPETKRAGAWMDDCLGREWIGAKLQLPVAYLVCNSTPPVGNEPSLMTFQEVTTLFHEFGHGLQHMLTEVDEAAVAGINGVEWDAVELPSQFMENWCYHKPLMLNLARHYRTGETLPEELFDKICAAKNFMSASFMLRQLRFGMTDMALHHDFTPTSVDAIFERAQEIAQQTAILPPLAEDRTLCSFSHIFAGGYAAGYYSYKWAEVLSADAFAAFEEGDLNNPQQVKAIGQKFRSTVLAKGGSAHPLEVFKAFRGREPQVEALLRHSGLKKVS